MPVTPDTEINATEPYRYRCPQGHTTIRTVGMSSRSHTEVEPSFRCETCRQAGREYRYAVVRDMKTGGDVRPRDPGGGKR